MLKKESEIRIVSGHVAVRLDHYILVLGGVYDFHHTESPNERTIWIFNLYTETWVTQAIPRPRKAPPTKCGASAVAIGRDIYMFGGSSWSSYLTSNAVWQLRRMPEGRFVWDKIKSKSNIVSPRCWHSGWEHAGKLWIFGGKGKYRPTRYLNDNGDFIAFNEDYVNNQLLCFDPSCQTWENPRCFGEVPKPRRSHATTTVRAKTWLFGGIGEPTSDNAFDDLFELNIDSLTWTKLLTGQPKPDKLYACTLTPLAQNQLILHGGCHDIDIRQGKTVHPTWILDLPSMTWKKYERGLTGPQRMHHTCTPGINRSVILLGGTRADGGELSLFHEYIYKQCHIMLEPKSLQQHATQTIHKHRDSLAWQTLPLKLVSFLNFL